MGFIAPLLLGGLAFLAIPWLLHRKRKPPRNPTPFSSLMFVPEAPPVTRARKQVEDRWLMLLRMLVLALMALAFARPFDRVVATPEGDEGAVALHVLLVDVSASMKVAGYQESRDNALDRILNEMKNMDRVAVVAFDVSPRVLLPFSQSETAATRDVDEARRVLDRLPESAGGTDYGAAIARAETLLGAISDPEGAPYRRVIHLVSDLQRSGLAGDAAVASESNELRIVSVGEAPSENVGVEELVVIPDGVEHVLVRGRVRNYGVDPVNVPVMIFANDAPSGELSIDIGGNGSRTLSHRVAVDRALTQRIAVQVMAEDPMPDDNVRYALLGPEILREIGVVTRDAAEAARFLDAAVAESQPLPWVLRPIGGDLEPDAWPPVVILTQSDVSEGQAETLATYVSGGGHLLLIPGAAGFGAAIEATLLSPAGFAIDGQRFPSAEPERFANFAWLDFDHPLFRNFREPTFSDFSAVRFHNFFRLESPEGLNNPVLARLEGEAVGTEYPAIATFPFGDGHVLVWSFPLDPAWTNLMRTRRFVPLLHESITLLLPEMAAARVWRTGEGVTVPDSLAEAGADATVRIPGVEDAMTLTDVADLLARPVEAGFLQWSATLESETDETITEPINLAGNEGDLSRFAEDEFLLRLGVAPDSAQTTVAGAGPMTPDVVHWEYGYYLLAILLGSYLLEGGLALWLGWQRSGAS